MHRTARVGLPQTSAYTLMGIKVQADIRVGVFVTRVPRVTTKRRDS